MNPKTPSREWSRVATYNALYEAEIAAGRLESAGIPHRLDQQGAVGLFGPGHAGQSVRGVALLVLKEHLDDARMALDLEEPAG